MSLTDRITDRKFDPYLGVVPTLLMDGKDVLKASHDDPETWTLVCDIARALNAYSRARVQLTAHEDTIRALTAKLDAANERVKEMEAGIAVHRGQFIGFGAGIDKELWALLDAPPTGETVCQTSSGNDEDEQHAHTGDGET